jgi:hypothetical protein
MVSKRDERHEQDGETLHQADWWCAASASGDPAMALVPFGIGQTICPVMKPGGTLPSGFDSGGSCRPLNTSRGTFPRANL